MAKLVVFGATGYAGGRISAEALSRGHEVVGVARNAGEAPEGVDLPPLLIAGNSGGVLGLAAEHADIVGFAGLRQLKGEPPGTFQLDNASTMDERVSYFRSRVGTRKVEYNMLVQRVVVTDDRRAAAEAWHDETERRAARNVDELLEAPQLLFGTVDQIVAQLLDRRDRYGFSYVTVFEPMLETFAPVLKELKDS